MDDAGKDLKSEIVPSITAVVGLSGVGKSEAVKFLVDKYSYSTVYFGGVVVNEVMRRGLSVTPENERMVREELRASDGMAVMAARSIESIREKLSMHGRVAIDGLYSAAELAFLRGEFGSRLVTIAIHSPHWLRAARLRDRKFRPLTSAEMNERDHFEIANLDKAPPIVLADLHVVNDGGIELLAERMYAAIESSRST
jgi:dephospho-CoA kinase